MKLIEWWDLYSIPICRCIQYRSVKSQLGVLPSALASATSYSSCSIAGADSRQLPRSNRIFKWKEITTACSFTSFTNSLPWNYWTSNFAALPIFKPLIAKPGEKGVVECTGSYMPYCSNLKRRTKVTSTCQHKTRTMDYLCKGSQLSCLMLYPASNWAK